MSLRSRFTLAAFATLLVARLAIADPEFRATPVESGLRVEIAGSYSGVWYSVARASDPAGEWRALSTGDVLCTGACYAYDLSAEPGGTYWYRFDLNTPAGLVSFGPYAATIPVPPPITASASPNPGSGPVRIDLQLAGTAATRIATEVALFDIHGRRVATIDRQARAPGQWAVTWNGRLDDGRPAPIGLYLLRFTAADGRATTLRLARVR